VREARDLAVGAPLAAQRLLEIAGGSPDAIEGPEVTQAALEGDPGAIECFDEVGRRLGEGMADLAPFDVRRFAASLLTEDPASPFPPRQAGSAGTPEREGQGGVF
jgi:hypothetical protein